MADAQITVAAFGRLVGATRAELEALISAGALPKPTGRDRRLPLREAAARYLAHLRAELATPGPAPLPAGRRKRGPVLPLSRSRWRGESSWTPTRSRSR